MARHPLRRAVTVSLARNLALGLALGLALAACGSGAGPARRSAPPARWVKFRHVAGVVDIAGPHGDGRFAVAAAGRLFLWSPPTLASSGLPHGGDIGVESTGFVPAGFGAGSTAYLADRYSPGNKHPGTNSILRLPGAELVKAGVRAGDLLAATEASARTIVVHCGRGCTVRYIAVGPEITHAEGHIAFTGSGR